MKDEIKEILDYCNKYINDKNMQYSEPMLNAKSLKLLLDYITNLQQRCEYLERSNNRREDEIMSLRDECVDGETYKSRNEKAINYIMTELITEWDIENGGCVSGSDLPVYAITPLLNILQGEDKDEK